MKIHMPRKSGEVFTFSYVEDECCDVVSITYFEDTGEYDVLSNCGFNYVLKPDPSSPYTLDIIWQEDEDEEYDSDQNYDDEEYDYDDDIDGEKDES